MNMKKIKRINKKSLIAIVIVALLVAGGIYAYSQRNANKSTSSADNPDSAETINLDPPTEQDKKNVEQNKEAIAERQKNLQNQNQQPGDDRKAVKPVITYAGQYGAQVEIGGYVPGVFEDGGTCTARFGNSNKSFTKSVEAVKNVNSMDCPAMIAKNEEFSPKGKWTVVVSYDSPSAAGPSDAKVIEIK